MPKVSIIIPVYNAEKYLKECMDSVVNQTLKDMEIICINDGSTDNSLEILNEYAGNDKRIKIINQKNQGAAVARNNGIEIANGDYVLILDCDDIFTLDLCEKLYNTSINNDTDITICNSINFDDLTKQDLPSNNINKIFLPNKKIFNYKDIPEHIYGFCQGWAWDKLYKRVFIEKNRLRFQNIKHSEDMYFVFYSLVLASRICFIDEMLVKHRVHVSTSVSNTRDKNPLEFIEAIYLLKNTLEKLGIYEDVKRSFINWNIGWCFWHLDTLKILKNKKSLAQKLKKEVFNKLDIYSLDKNYFYSISQYKRLHWRNLLQQHPYQNIFSIRNECSGRKIYKVITILRLKLKFRNKAKERKIRLNEQEQMLMCIKEQNEKILKYLENNVSISHSRLR